METEIFYSDEYTAAGVSFATTRKAGWIADSLKSAPIRGARIVAPQLLTETQLSEVHDPHYVNALKTGQPESLAASSGFYWDAGVWRAVRASNGGAVCAALSAMKHGASGSLSSGLHHAKYSRRDGFCTFNGLAIAANEALKAGARTILIVDLDAHCGGGTRSLLKNNPKIWHLDISTNYGDGYVPGERFTLDVIEDAALYLPTLQQRLDQLESLSFDLCLYNAGMDAYEGCNLGGLAGLSVEKIYQRERQVFEWCKKRHLPIAFVLAGGYLGPNLSHEKLVALHRLTIEQAALFF